MHHLPRRFFSLRHIIIALWSVTLAYLLLSLLGMSHLLSNLVSENQIVPLVEMAFFALSGIFAIICKRFFPSLRTLSGKFLAIIPPLLIFIILLL